MRVAPEISTMLRALRNELGGARLKAKPGKYRVQPSRYDRRQQARRQFADPGHQRLVVLVVLADHPLRLVTGIVVEIFLELAFDDAALLLDHEDLALLPHEFQRVVMGERPHHPDLVDIDAEPPAFGLGQAEQLQRLHQVEMSPCRW